MTRPTARPTNVSIVDCSLIDEGGEEIYASLALGCDVMAYCSEHYFRLVLQ